MNFPYPYFPIQFKKDGSIFQPSDVDALMNGVTTGDQRISDLFILCHGWNNNMDDATSLYEGLSALIKTQIDRSPALASRTYAICGVLWPSKKFDDKNLIPSGAASLNDLVGVDLLKQRVSDLRSLYAASEWPAASDPAPEFDEIERLMEVVEDDPEAQEKVVKLLRQLLPPGAKSPEDASDCFFELRPTVLINNLSQRLTPPLIQPSTGGAASLDPESDEDESGAGGAAGLRDVMGGIKSGFLNLLNYATYYLMKARAGTVGVNGVAPLLVELRDSRDDLRIHIIGHSFGCRLACAAINALSLDERYRPDTLMLLQGAFSHNGFAMENQAADVPRGIFRDIIEQKKVRGPILITHTRKDKAVGIAYPIASRINGVTACSLGDADDIFGGLGSNGTQTPATTPEGVPDGTLKQVGFDYPFANGVKPSTPYNLNADKYIQNHSDIKQAEVAFALVVGMAAPRE